MTSTPLLMSAPGRAVHTTPARTPGPSPSPSPLPAQAQQQEQEQEAEAAAAVAAAAAAEPVGAAADVAAAEVPAAAVGDGDEGFRTQRRRGVGGAVLPATGEATGGAVLPAAVEARPSTPKTRFMYRDVGTRGSRRGTPNAMVGVWGCCRVLGTPPNLGCTWHRRTAPAPA